MLPPENIYSLSDISAELVGVRVSTLALQELRRRMCDCWVGLHAACCVSKTQGFHQESSHILQHVTSAPPCSVMKELGWVGLGCGSVG